MPSNTRCLIALRKSPQPRTRPPKPRIASCADLAIPLFPPAAWTGLPICRPPPEGRNPYASDKPIFLQHPANSFKGGGEGRLVMHDRQPDIGLAGIRPALRRPRGIAAQQHPNRRVAPQPQGRLLAVADLQPQKEPALRPVETVAARPSRLGDVEFAAVFSAVLPHLPPLPPPPGAAPLDRPRP